MMKKRIKPGDKLVVFGCIFNANWEYDAPCVLYSGMRAYGMGGNSGHLDSLLEDALWQWSCAGWRLPVWWSSTTLDEFHWRKWSLRGFRHRKDATHVRFIVKFFVGEYGALSWKIVDRKERRGPFKTLKPARR